MPKTAEGEASYRKRYSEETIKKAVEEVLAGAPKKTVAKNTIYQGPLCNSGLATSLLKLLMDRHLS